jgi:lysophospholipase L1-like esterase
MSWEGERGNMRRALTIGVIGVLVAFVAFATLDEALRVLYVVRTYLMYGGVQQPGMIDHPFLTVQMSPSSHFRARGVDVVTDSRGFRTPEFTDAKPRGTYRIVVVGGSGGVAGSRNRTTFESMLEEMLNRAARGGRHRYEVINAASPYWTSTQELFLIATEAIYWHPDMVIVYDGWNDAEMAMRADWRPNWNYRNTRVMWQLHEDERPLVSQFFIVHLVYDRLHPRPGLAFAFHPEGVAVYEQNLRSMVAILRDRGIVPVLTQQPSLLSKVDPTPYEERSLSRPDATRYYGVRIDLMKTYLPLECQAMTQVALRYHLLHQCLTSIFDHAPGTTFNDLVHATDLGNEIVAERMFELIAPAMPDKMDLSVKPAVDNRGAPTLPGK